MRTVGSNRNDTLQAIRQSAVKLIYEHGYEAMSLRLLAKEVGIQAGSLYNYIQSKQSFLYQLLKEITEESLVELKARLEGIDDPAERLRAFIAQHIEFHTRRPKEVFISNMELRSLSPKHYKAVVALRDKYQGCLREIIDDGIAKGSFRVDDPGVATAAIIAMLAGPSVWYRSKGRHSLQSLTEIYTGMVFDLLGGTRATTRRRVLQRA